MIQTLPVGVSDVQGDKITSADKKISGLMFGQVFLGPRMIPKIDWLCGVQTKADKKIPDLP